MEFKEAFSSSFELFLFFWLTCSLVHRLVVVRTVACSLLCGGDRLAAAAFLSSVLCGGTHM